MAKGNASNLVDPARRKKMNNFYKTDLPKFMKHLGKDSLNSYEKSFIMARAWAAVDGREGDFPYSSLSAYIKENKPRLDKRAAASKAKREAKKEKKEEEKAKEKAKKAKAKAKDKK